MHCENKFCCYFFDHTCILQEIEINSLGMCDSQIMVEVEEEQLSQKRKEQLERFCKYDFQFDKKP